MAIVTCGVLVLGMLQLALCGSPVVPCPAPRSPEHGQAFLYQEGHVVKFSCEPGYALQGKGIVRCIEGRWEDPNPACLEIGANEIKSEPMTDSMDPMQPARPLFSWGSDNDQEQISEEVNDTAEELPLSDEARIKLLLYPRRKVITRVRTSKLQRASELEEEEKKRSREDKTDSTSTTIHLESPPSMVYVRRTVVPGKSEAARRALEAQYKAASLHMTVDNGNDVQLITVPTAAVSVNGKEYLTDESFRQLYWYGHHYPRETSLIEYSSGSPVVMTLTESQLAWINSLHPELREKYLKDLYAMRAEETAETEKAKAFLRRYEDAYQYLHHIPYVRRPVSLIVEDPVSTYDYTCHESGQPFVKAPRLRNMHIARYDRRQNPNSPHNDYLTAVYRCNPGYIMLDTRYTELHCSKKDWIGVKPVCVWRG